MNLLELKNASARLGDQRVFDGLNLEIPCGANTAILGANGSGKSSLLKLINRQLYIQPNENSRCLLFGQALWNVTELRQRMRLVSQDLQQSLLQESTGLMVVASGIYDSVTTWAHQSYSSDDLQKARKWMAYFGVAELENRTIQAMSTGQQRRLLLARAMVTEPDYLILDEPTTALDIGARAHLLKLLSELMLAGHHTVMVTHQVEEILPQVDHLIFLQSGRVVATGAPQAILRSDLLSDLFGLKLKLFRDDAGWHCHAA